MRKKQEQIKQLRKKGNKYIKDTNYDKAIETFLEGLKLDSTDETFLKNLSNSYFHIKQYDKAEYYSQLLLDIDKKNIDANNIKFNSLVRQNKIDAAKDFLEKNEVLKNQQNYNELKSLVDPEFAKNLQNIIKLNPSKKSRLNSYILDYRKLFQMEKNQFYIDGELAKEYINPKLTLLEKQEHGTKIIANQDIKKGEIICVSKALLVHLEQSINDMEFFKNIYQNFNEEQKAKFLSLSTKENLNLSLKERIEKGKHIEDINEVIKIYNHNCYSIGGGVLTLLKPYPYEGSGCFIYPAYMNHSCDPNTFRFTIGDLFILIAMRDIKKNEEVCTIYFSMEKTYEERQKKI